MVRPIIKNKFFIIFSIFIYCLVIPGCNDTSKPGIIIKDAHLYLPLKGTDISAGYLRLENNQIKKIVISSIECEKVKASIHETILNSDGVMKMKKLERFAVEAESNLNFMPGGKHVMFSGLKEFKESILVCTFLSNTGIEIPFTFEVLKNER
jgi:copper(I)-binding protein